MLRIQAEYNQQVLTIMQLHLTIWNVRFSVMDYSVLLAEDEPNIALSLQFIMNKAGFSVRVAEDGELAILEIEKEMPDVILLDIMLAKRDGFSVLETIKENPKWSSIKVIVLTAKSRDEDKQRALNLGADDYITKPFSSRQLVDRVIDLLGGDIVRVQLPKYPVALDFQDTPFLLLEQNQNQTYIAQSGLIGPNGLDKNGQRPKYMSSVRALNIDDSDGQSDLVLSTVADGVTVEKVFSFTPDAYLLSVSYRLTNTSDDVFTAGMFTQIKRDRKAVLADDSFSLAPDPYLGGAITTLETPYQKVEFDDLDEDALQAENTGGWVAFLQHYFLSAWVAPTEQQIRYYARPTKDNNYLFGFTALVEW